MQINKHLSSDEKRIYNAYLHALRAGKPVKSRQNFDNISDEDYVTLKQLYLFFKAVPNVDIDEFFAAGFKDNEFHPLKFFKSQRAVKVYNLYMFRKVKSADSDESIKYLQNSLLFLHQFCRDNNIRIDKYLDERSPGGIPWCLIHLKQLNISVYLFLAFSNSDLKILEYSDNIKSFMGMEFMNNLKQYRTQFITSVMCKKIARQGLERLSAVRAAANKTEIQNTHE